MKKFLNKVAIFWGVLALLAILSLTASIFMPQLRTENLWFESKTAFLVGCVCAFALAIGLKLVASKEQSGQVGEWPKYRRVLLVTRKICVFLCLFLVAGSVQEFVQFGGIDEKPWIAVPILVFLSFLLAKGWKKPPGDLVSDEGSH